MTGGTSGAADRLRSGIERIERLLEEVAALKSDMKDIYTELKSAGFDAKVVRQMIKERAMDAAEREEWQTLCETYRAALGMLDGTPLGEATRKRLLGQPPKPDNDAEASEPEGHDDAQAGAAPAAPAAPAALTPEDLLAARAQGVAAALAGRKVTENPFAASDARRAAWDEGWCSESGSDGMDIPSAFRRSSPRKPGKGTGPGKGA